MIGAGGREAGPSDRGKDSECKRFQRLFKPWSNAALSQVLCVIMQQ